EWDEDPVVFIKNALNPAEVIDVYLNEEEHECVAVVPDTQLSLAIGRRGQNVRLAARLTGYKIDIKSESDFDSEEYAELEAIKDIAEDSNEEEVSPDRSAEPILDESEDFFDTLNDMAEESEPKEVEDTEDFFDIFDDQQDEDSPIDTKALDTDEETPREHDEVIEEQKKEMVRNVRTKENEIFIDDTGKKNGRGAYVSMDETVIKQAKAKDILSGVLKTQISDDFYDELLSHVKYRLARIEIMKQNEQ